MGNGALTKARQMLLCGERREDVERIAPQIEQVKLSEEEDFLERHVEELNLGYWPEPWRFGGG